MSISNVGNNLRMLYLNNGIAWGNTNAGIYPASFNTTNFEFVRSNDVATTVATPSPAHIDFGTPMLDPILIVYSLDNSGVTIKGTLDTAGNPAVTSIASNQPTKIDLPNQAISGPFAGGTNNREGCISGSRRVCGIFRFTGSYSQLTLGQFGNTGDGVGFQIGVAITPAATNESFTGTSGVAQVAVANIRANDTLTGAQGSSITATNANTTVAPLGWPTGISVDPTTGAVSVDASVASGSYTLPYKLCDAADANNCANGQVLIELQAPPPPPPPVVTPPAAVPTLGQWAIMLLGTLTALTGGLWLRRKHGL